MKLLYKISFLFLVLSLFSCKESPEATVVEPDDSNDLINISKAQFKDNQFETGTIQEMDFPEVVRSNGRIDVPPQNRASISSLMGGYIKNINLLEGQKVSRGQFLVSLENTEFVELQQDYMDVAGQLNYLQAEYERQQTMLEENITSRKNFLKAESDYNRALSAKKGLDKKLQMLNIDPAKVESGEVTPSVNIYSPINGNVSNVSVSPGNFVTPTDRIMEIIDPEKIHLELVIFEKDIRKIKEGQKILFNTPEASEKDFVAEVGYIGKTIDQQTRNVRIHGHLPDSIASEFTVGMFVEARIITENIQKPGLPEEAVVEQDGEYFVLVLEEEDEQNYSFRKQEVNVGKTYEGKMGLENVENLENETILLNGAFNLIGEAGEE